MRVEAIDAAFAAYTRHALAWVLAHIDKMIWRDMARYDAIQCDIVRYNA